MRKRDSGLSFRSEQKMVVITGWSYGGIPLQFTRIQKHKKLENKPSRKRNDDG